MVAFFALVVLSPLFLAIALVLFVAQGKPIIFGQIRAGLAGKNFTLLKFRTMRVVPDGESDPDNDEIRITRIGRWLRQSSLDEIPEFWNILKGDMSLVGPRPLLPRYLPRYTKEQARRHHVKPGLTGWAQVNGRNAVDWDERLRMDVWYVDNASLALDMRIIAKTVFVLFKGRGIAQPGRATMSEFWGTESEQRSKSNREAETS